MKLYSLVIRNKNYQCVINFANKVAAEEKHLSIQMGMRLYFDFIYKHGGKTDKMVLEELIVESFGASKKKVSSDIIALFGRRPAPLIKHPQSRQQRLELDKQLAEIREEQIAWDRSVFDFQRKQFFEVAYANKIKFCVDNCILPEVLDYFAECTFVELIENESVDF